MLRKLLDFWLKHINPRLNTLITIVGTLGLISCFLAFIFLFWLVKGVLKRETFNFDQSFLLTIYPYENSGLDQFMLFITRFGNPEVMIPIAILSLGLLWWKNNQLEAKIFVIGCLGATILNLGLKLMFERSRPALWKQLITETSFSFPSGHALGSLFFYGFLAYLLAQKYPQLRLTIYSLTTLFITTIGLSRLYLGVHWPSDVLAGYGISIIWLTTCITMLKLQQLRLARRLALSQKAKEDSRLEPKA
ncbi:MAG: phosphatase PAP2 family protein [Snowella sp.]|nr:phosphatase PAP2 family protein [Snowella sp.]